MPDATDSPETWRPIGGYEGIYEVSDHGRVRSLDRATRTIDGRVFHLRGQILKPRIRTDGRHRVTLSRAGCTTDFVVHRLVLSTFVGPCPAGMECCHNNGNHTDNRLSNLRWDTSSANMLDKQRHGTDHQRNKVRCPQGHLLTHPNLVRVFSTIGHRSCLACSRARAAKQGAVRRGDTWFHFQAVADAYYARIMAA